jgi:hypothetical protein
MVKEMFYYSCFTPELIMQNKGKKNKQEITSYHQIYLPTSL